MTFNQSSWQLQNSTVYNIAGGLYLTQQSGTPEFAHVVAELRERIRALEDVPESERETLDQELADIVVDSGDADSAEDDGGEGERPDGDAVAGRLTRIGDRLRALAGTTGAAMELGNSLDTLAQWAGQHF